MHFTHKMTFTIGNNSNNDSNLSRTHKCFKSKSTVYVIKLSVNAQYSQPK